MGKIDGFLSYKRKNFTYKKVEERVKDYKEFVKLLSKKEVQTQGARCMDCGIPFCHSMGCPVYNLIPDWNELVYQDRWHDAYERLEMTNNLPEITGRVCPAPAGFCRCRNGPGRRSRSAPLPGRAISRPERSFPFP